MSTRCNILLAIISFCFLISCFAQNKITVDWKSGHNDLSCRSNQVPCRSLDYALNISTNNTVINIYSGIQFMEDNAVMADVMNVSIVGNPIGTHIKCNHVDIGIMIVRVLNLTITNISISGCGSFHDSTFSSDRYNIIKFISAIYIINSTTLIIENVTIEDNNGTGLVLYDTGGTVLIKNSHFINNKVSVNLYHGGGGVYIEFTSCTPGTPISACYNSVTNPHVSNNTYEIVNCVFTGNEANIPPNTSWLYIQEHGHKYQPIFEAGGGISLSLKGKSLHNQIIIENCVFTGNTALIGGGMAILIEDEANNNNITITGSKFEMNFAKRGGGGIEFGFFNVHLVNNSIKFTNISFLSNEALEYGGGTSMYSARTPYGTSSSNTVTFSSCYWAKNTANIGAAVILFPEDWSLLSGYLPIPLFENCTFIGNEVVTGSTSQLYLLEGIIFSDTFSMNFTSTITITNNLGSGILLLAGNLNILPNAVINISSNTALNGAGIALIGYAAITANENSTITFENNKALDKGGAIYYNTVDPLESVNSRHCFIQYVDILPANEWKATYNFINNIATNYGHSIYAVSLKACAEGSIVNGSNVINYKHVFHSKTFHFTPNLDTEHIISTAPAKLEVVNDHVNASPGLVYPLDMEIKDDLNQSADAMLLTTCTNGYSSHCKVSEQFQYTSDKNLFCIGPVNSSLNITIITMNSRPIAASIVVNLIPCPPGYVLSKRLYSCICSVSSTTPIPAVVACNQSKGEAMLKLGYWAGCDTANDVLMTAQCPTGFCNTNDKLFYLRKDCDDLEQHICADNRQGRLCGECKQNYSVYYHSQRFKCGECTSPYSSLGWLFYILSEIVPLTLLFVFVIFFDVSFTSGAVNSFLFFVQVFDFFQVTAFNNNYSLHILTDSYRFFFGFFNMDFFQLDELSFCLWEEAKVLDVLAFKYVTTAYGLFLILFLFLLLKYCNCGKLRKCFGSNTRDGQYSTIHGITSFLIITYSQCAKVSFQILAQENLVKAGNKIVHTVVFWSGQTEFFGKDHLKYAIPAMFVIGYIILLPLLLIVHPLYYTVKRFLINKRIIKDEIGNRYWLNQKCTFMIAKINLFFKPTLDAFQSCFKDDMRWYAGLYFVCRLLISAGFAFTNTPLSMYTLLEVIVVCMLAIHSVCQPYQKRFYNILDSLMLANLAIINGINFFNLASAEFLSIYGGFLSALQLILIYLPIMYAIVFAVFKKSRFIRMKMKKLNKCIRLFDPDLEEQQIPMNESDDVVCSFNCAYLPDRMFEVPKKYNEGQKIARGNTIYGTAESDQ